MLRIPVRTTLSAALAATAVLIVTAPVSAAPKTRSCSPVSVVLKGGVRSRAVGIHATGYGCRPARVVARACLRDRLHGWKTYTAPSPDDRHPHGLTGLDRGHAHISFEVRGRGGCA